MTQEKEAFLDRWSRLKHEQPQEEPAPPAETKPEQEIPAPPLPEVKDLTPESDFAPFMNAKVDDATRRSALKKLFTDPHFNVPDPYEAYSEDYTKSDPIPAAMLLAINKARDLAINGPEQSAEEKVVPEEAKVETPKIETPTQESESPAGKQDA